MTDVCVRGRAALKPIVCLAISLFTAALAAPAHAAAPIAVELDRAMLIKLPERTATVVVGNPLIADLSIQPNGLAVITGKGFGATNFIVLDKDGVVLAEHTVQVVGPVDPTVVVYRGVRRETYSCTPECSRRITLGDDAQYFNETMSESASRNSQALAAASSQQH
jgi:hypothetical protein